MICAVTAGIGRAKILTDILNKGGNMRDTVTILGVKVDKVTEQQALDRAMGFLSGDKAAKIYTPNPEIIMQANEDSSFMQALNEADLCTADGIGVVYGAKILKNPVPCRVAGFDLTCNILEKMKETEDSVFLFGAKPGVAEIAASRIEKRYRGLRVAGTNDGYFTNEDIPAIIEKINQSGAKLLLVCLGAGKQEKWIAENCQRLTSVRLCMGVGGTLDVLAGNVKRAPKLFIKLNLEWLYRFIKQPSRLGRFAALPKFMIRVFKSRKEIKQ